MDPRVKPEDEEEEAGQEGAEDRLKFASAPRRRKIILTNNICDHKL